MAFGFKKKNFADTIFTGGNIYIGEEEETFVEAVAVRNGKIMALGDSSDMEELASPDTVIHDLEGKFVYPGFIDAHGTFLRELFRNRYPELDPVWDMDKVLDEIRDAMPEDGSTLFAWGFNHRLLDDYPTPEDRRMLLDEISSETSIVIMADDGFTLWLNSAAKDILDQVMEEEDEENITINQALFILVDYDEEALTAAITDLSREMAEKGFTAVFDSFSNQFFNSVFQHAYFTASEDAEPILQRFMGSVTVNRRLMPMLLTELLINERTRFSELDGLIQYNTLKLEAGTDEALSHVRPEDLMEMISPAAERGFNINIEALDEESFIRAYRVLDTLRDKGCRNNTFVIASDSCLSDELKADLIAPETIVTTWPTSMVSRPVTDNCHTAEEALAQLTEEAALITGTSERLGTIAVGSCADFAVFSEDLLRSDVRSFADLSADMTVVGGEIVYDRENEETSELYDILMSQRV